MRRARPLFRCTAFVALSLVFSSALAAPQVGDPAPDFELEASDGNREETARRLGVDPSTLYRRLKNLDIEP